MPEMYQLGAEPQQERILLRKISELTLTRRLVSTRHGEDHALTRKLSRIITAIDIHAIPDPIVVFEGDEFSLVQNVLLDRVFSVDTGGGVHGATWEQEQARYIMINNKEAVPRA